MTSTRSRWPVHVLLARGTARFDQRAFAALTCLVLWACAPVAEEEPEELRVTTQALNGGTPTTARPEVGQYLVDVNGDGIFDSCTATMISSTWFLTAAHCLNWTPRASGGFFRLHGVEGLPSMVQLPVVETFSLGPSLGAGDVAVGRIFTPMPAAVTPAQISRFHPASQDAMTFMGFGCDLQEDPDDIPYLGKRFLQTTMGGTGRLCPGDSGGPAFRGSLSDNGEIAAVHSDGNPDRFGDAVVYKELIEAVIRQTVNGHEKDIDRPGGDYTSDLLPAGSHAGTCEANCRRDSVCRAWSYRLSDRKCTRKTLVRDTKPRLGVISGLGMAPITATDRFGSDYATYPVARAEICEADCARDLNCAAYTVVNGSCSLKNSVPSGSACPSCTSGNRKGIEPNSDRRGSDYTHFTTTGGALACMNECAKDARCTAFTYNPIGSVCWLKDHTPQPSEARGMSSGVRRGYEFNVNRPGNDIQEIAIADRRPWNCQAACARNSACRSWSMSLFTGRCFLKNGIPAAQAADGTVSGRKGMEFF